MNRRMAKILAVVSSTTAVGVMPLLGANISEVALSDQEKILGNGIVDVLYDKELFEIANIDVSELDTAVVTTEEYDFENTPMRDEIISTYNIAYTISISGQNGFKSYMSYKTITNGSSKQYALQTLANTGDYGIRVVDGRYCIAVGTALNASVGTYLDLVLDNGTIIPCIVGDIKANEHTLPDNLTTAANGCVSEFIVDGSSLDYSIKSSGNASSIEGWDSAVVEFIVYDYNILNKQ